MKWYVKVIAVIVSIVLNVLLSRMNQFYNLPLFLDSTFTVVTAGLFGLIPGLVVALLTNLGHEAIAGFPGLIYPFALVNMLSAVITWFFVKKKFFTDAAGAFWLIIILALGNSLLGTVIVMLVFNGITNDPLDDIVRAIVISGQSVFSAAFLARIFINIVDKGIAVLILFPLYTVLRKRWLRRYEN